MGERHSEFEEQQNQEAVRKKATSLEIQKMEPSKSNETAQPPLTNAPKAALHEDDADEDDESVKQLQQCSALYLSLQNCLIEKNRNWRSCQPEVQALKACNERRNKGRNSYANVANTS